MRSIIVTDFRISDFLFPVLNMVLIPIWSTQVLFHGRLVPDNTVDLSHNCYCLIFKTPISYLESLFFLSISFIHFIFTQIPALFKTLFRSDCFSSPQKVGPHDQQQPFHQFPSHQQEINLNERKKLQYTPNKVYIFESSSNYRATV